MPDADAGLYFAFFTEIGIISQLSRAMMEARLPDDMTVPQFSVLNHLIRRGDGQTPLEISTAFQVPKTSMSHTLAGLEKRGMIEMRPNPKDGRSKCVHILPAGTAFLDRILAELVPDVGRLSETVPQSVVQEILPHLIEIRKKMDAARD